MKKLKKYKSNVGYNRKNYSYSKSIARFKRTGKFKYVKSGEGHRAGENWGDDKGIDPSSQVRRYSKNSPSFDEGVYKSKQKRKLSEGKAKSYFDLGEYTHGNSAKSKALSKKM